MKLTTKILNSITQISAQDWNGLSQTHYPFLRHEFLSALEASGCTNAQSGWQPTHITVYQEDKLIAIMPMFQKTHSSGEFVFDWDWADAYKRNGLEYYPKLLTAIPFSPCYGPRVASLLALDEIIPFISTQITQLCADYGFSGWHGLFQQTAEQELFEHQNFLVRQGVQYHWHNKGYQDFDHYLASFTSRKRKGIKRERRIVKDQEVSIQAIEGANISDQLLQDFFHCYQLTYLKRGRQGYLNIDFFQHLIATMSEHIVLFVAQHQGATVACAWCFKNTDPEQSVLYGRYWGALENFDSLHFETCYYQALEYCIEQKIQRFDPGAQGEHKIQRGFEPITTYSTHYISHPQFREAIADFLVRETSAVDEHKNYLASFLPFKQHNEEQNKTHKTKQD